MARVYFDITSYVDFISSQRSSSSQSLGATLYEDLCFRAVLPHACESPELLGKTATLSSILYTDIICFLCTISKSLRFFRRVLLFKCIGSVLEHRSFMVLTALRTCDLGSSSVSLGSSSYHTSSSSRPLESRCELIRRRWDLRTASARRYGSLRSPCSMSSRAPLYTSSWCSSFFSPTDCDFVFNSLITASC